MKKRGIIMSGDNPKLILDGSKTQTRRIITKPEFDVIKGHSETVGPIFRVKNGKVGGCLTANDFAFCYCPYGVAGDRLYCKEVFGVYSADEGTQSFIYKADYRDDETTRSEMAEVVKWKSSRFMPKSAARITLEITRVRVERVQDIREEDAEAEGVEQTNVEHPINPLCLSPRSYVLTYSRLWDSLHGKGAWERNDWVWVLEFRKLIENNP